MPRTNNTFKIGLCMAGAVSAGAYTAGVIDYLIESLEEWQKRKDNNDPDTPSHQVEISVIGGASAGGMTGIIAASAIQDKIEPVRESGSNIMTPIPNNKFYHSWVDLTNDEMLSVLLDTSDISKYGLQSALNSEFIDKLAYRALSATDGPVIRRKYISDNLKVFVTLSNLEGMDFSLEFQPSSTSQKSNRYIVSNHNDYACFKLCNTEDDYDNDGWIPLNFKTKLNTETAKQAAMATGAFPVGLKARELSRSNKYMNDLDWFNYITKDAQNPFKNEPYTTVNVDGGMINNEPFDKVRELLMQETNLKVTEGMDPEDLNEIQDHNKFKSTVIMIDPFPSEPGDFDKSTEMMTIIKNTIGAMIGQARVKSSVLIDAMNPKEAGQYLISPVRYDKTGGTEKKIEGKKAIACGSLGGFGGFISKEFRIHDFFLGRANCEIFLREYFTIPINNTNEIFTNGYSGVPDNLFKSKDGKLQIIPIFTEKSEAYIPKFSNEKKWPSVSNTYVESHRSMIKSRVHKILLNMAEYSNADRVKLWIGAKVFLNGKIAKSVINSVIESLEDHELIKHPTTKS